MTKQQAVRVTTMLFVAFLMLAGVLIPVRQAEAASLTSTYLRLSRMSTAGSGPARVVFRTAGAGATSVSINMNGADTTTWTGQSGSVATTQTVSSAGCATETGATALPGTLAASGSGSTISITGVTALSSATTYCVDLTSATAVTNPTAAGEYHPLITAGSDSVTIAVRVVTNDQVTVTAVVPPTFNMVLNTNTDSFTANLSPGSVGLSSGVTATVNTNARNGWLAWAKGANTGLTSAAASKTIAATTPGTSATLTAGTEGYVVGITNIAQGSGAGTTAAIVAYDATGAAHGSGLDDSLRQIASSSGTAANAVLTLRSRAAINSLTPAANDYTDTVTIIGAARF